MFWKCFSADGTILGACGSFVRWVLAGGNRSLGTGPWKLNPSPDSGPFLLPGPWITPGFLLTFSITFHWTLIQQKTKINLSFLRWFPWGYHHSNAKADSTTSLPPLPAGAPYGVIQKERVQSGKYVPSSSCHPNCRLHERGPNSLMGFSSKESQECQTSNGIGDAI